LFRLFARLVVLLSLVFGESFLVTVVVGEMEWKSILTTTLLNIVA